MLAKSKYDIDKKFTAVFDEIDNPTEKERAEIREINARTDSTYINSGVVSAQEIRDVLRADEKSGYTALAEEIEGEVFDPDEEEYGGSSNEQTPFSMDYEEPEMWITSKGTPIPIFKGKNKRKQVRAFLEQKRREQGYEQENQERPNEDLKHSYKNQKETLDNLGITELEFYSVVHQINNKYHSKVNNYENEEIIIHIGTNSVYIVRNNGFNNYEFCGKLSSDEASKIKLEEWKKQK